MPIELSEKFNSVPIEVYRVSGARLLWRDKSYSDFDEIKDEQFVKNCSWVVKDSFFSKKDRVVNEDKRIALAERYGGFGIGCNGGGARVVNIDGMQLKGIGGNPLAGEGSPRSHSYGGLDVQGAVKEIIYSRLLNAISPVGAQKIHGLILLDENSAFHNKNSAPSVIMVREPVMRPAHFLPCANFKIKPEYRGSIKSDYSRVLSIYKSIGNQSKLSEFYIIIQKFLEKCADQMSFFRMARFSHGALAPSNICLDGRVLDTSLCSFVISGSNYGQATSFFDEVTTPVLVVREIFHLIEKYSLSKPVADHFIKLYEEKFHSYAPINLGFLFGVDREASTKLASTPEWQKVATQYLSLVSMGSPENTDKLPTVDSPDFINNIVSACLFSVLHDRIFGKSNNFLNDFSENMDSLISVVSSSFGVDDKGLESFRRVFSIQMLKRVMLTSYFFITYIGRAVDENYSSGGVDNTKKIIDENDRVVGWVFENLAHENCTLYSGNDISVRYDCHDDVYIYTDQSGSEKYFNDAQELLDTVKNDKSSYVIQSYDFRPFLMHLCALLAGDASESFTGVKNVFS